MSNKAKAALVVDVLVEQDGLDVSAMMQRKIEARILKAIEATEKSMRNKLYDIIDRSHNVNDLSETDVEWIDKEDLLESLKN